MQNRIELVILKHLLNEEDYARRTLQYLKSEYFSEVNEKNIYQEIDKYLEDFNFKRVETKWCENFGWGDALYIKNICYSNFY